MENDKLYAIILLENQRSVRESVKRGFNDVRRFFFQEEEKKCSMGSGTGALMVWDVCKAIVLAEQVLLTA